MSYILCNVKDCTHHDGKGCTLETVEICKPKINLRLSGYECYLNQAVFPDIAVCKDYNPLFGF